MKMVRKKKSSTPWAVPGELCVHHAPQRQVHYPAPDLIYFIYFQPFNAHFHTSSYIIVCFFLPSIIRWQPHVRRVRNTVQTQQRLRVLDGVGWCHGDHCPSLVSLTVKPVLLYVVVQASAARSPRRPSLSRLLPSSAEKRTRKQTVAPGWCTNSST